MHHTLFDGVCNLQESSFVPLSSWDTKDVCRHDRLLQLRLLAQSKQVPGYAKHGVIILQFLASGTSSCFLTQY